MVSGGKATGGIKQYNGRKHVLYNYDASVIQKMVKDRKHITDILLTLTKTKFNIISKEKPYALGY